MHNATLKSRVSLWQELNVRWHTVFLAGKSPNSWSCTACLPLSCCARHINFPIPAAYARASADQPPHNTSCFMHNANFLRIRILCLSRARTCFCRPTSLQPFLLRPRILCDGVKVHPAALTYLIITPHGNERAPNHHVAPFMHLNPPNVLSVTLLCTDQPPV